MNPRYAVVAAAAGHRCEYCHAPEAVFNLPFEVEHILPPGHGGNDELENLALACRACNLFKSDCVRVMDHLTGALVRLFHPRRDHWHDHFRATELGTMEGLTDIGRITVDQLRMNSPSQVAARIAWMKLGLLGR